MLICPECQSKNPDSNNFCQQCGNSLTESACEGCGASISLTVKECPHCGEANLPRLLAIVIPKATAQPELVSSKRDRAAAPSFEERLASLSSSKKPKLEIDYLDSQQRYQLDPQARQTSRTIVTGEVEQTVISTKVWDRFPIQQSYLSLLQEEQKELFSELQREQNSSYLSVGHYWNTLGLPTIALPYLMLEIDAAVIPPLHDAWYEEDTGAILLSDRSDWQVLAELWQNKAIPPEQVLWSLNEMLEYWTPLMEVGCGTTLLDKDNLRLDEYGSFGVVQLHLDSLQQPPQIADLAARWKSWLIESGILDLTEDPEGYLVQLKEILQEAIDGEITAVADLQQRLYYLANPEAAKANKPSTSDTEATEWLEKQETAFRFEENGIDSLLYTNVEDTPTATIAMEIANVSEASCTDVGSQRDHNEDFFGTKTTLIREESPVNKTIQVRGLYVVCDGMGGHSAGEVASAMAVETLENYFYTYWKEELPDEETIADGVYLANRAIYQTNVENNCSGSDMMGTTLVMALLQDTQLAIAHVGDSRIYRITRSYGLEQLTQDHEVGQREINRGIEPEIAYGRPDAYQLTQALGPRENKYIRPAIEFLDIHEDCLLLLCSDGLSDNDLIEKHWQSYIEPLLSSSADLQSGLFKLIDFADRYNGHDNITGILLRIKLQPNFEI